MKRVGIFLFFGLSSLAWAAPAQRLSEHRYQICGQRVQLEVADTPERREKGLMGREGIPHGHGMLFVFEREQPVHFWMKNVPFNIDIGFFDAKGNLINALTMKGSSPLQRDEALPRYASSRPARYAVELSEGFFTRKKTCRLTPTQP